MNIIHLELKNNKKQKWNELNHKPIPNKAQSKTLDKSINFSDELGMQMTSGAVLITWMDVLFSYLAQSYFFVVIYVITDHHWSWKKAQKMNKLRKQERRETVGREWRDIWLHKRFQSAFPSSSTFNISLINLPTAACPSLCISFWSFEYKKS